MYNVKPYDILKILNEIPRRSTRSSCCSGSSNSQPNENTTITAECSSPMNMSVKESKQYNWDTKCAQLRGITYVWFNPLNPELNPICYLLALLGAHHFLHVSRIRVKLLTFRLLMSYIYIYTYIYGAPILDVSRSHKTTQHSR